MRCLVPNDKTHPAFGEALRRAAGAGVLIAARECRVLPGEITIAGEIPVFPDGIPGQTTGNPPGQKPLWRTEG